MSLDAFGTVAERLSGHEIVRVDAGGTRSITEASVWSGGRINLLAVSSDLTPDGQVSEAVAAWTMHVETGGYVAFHGWTAGQIPGIPWIGWFKGPDGRVWVPITYEPVLGEPLLVFQIVGVMTDG